MGPRQREILALKAQILKEEERKQKPAKQRLKPPLPSFNHDKKKWSLRDAVLKVGRLLRPGISDRIRYSKLTKAELDFCRAKYDQYSPLKYDFSDPGDTWKLLGLLQALGQQASEEELFRFFTDLRNPSVRRYLDFESFLLLMEHLKLRHWEMMSDPELETLEAFVALGGNMDRSGLVDTKVLMDAVVQFNLSIDIWTIIAQVDKDSLGMVNWAQFCSIFVNISQLGGSSAEGLFSSAYSDVDPNRDLDDELADDTLRRFGSDRRTSMASATLQDRTNDQNDDGARGRLRSAVTALRMTEGATERQQSVTAAGAGSLTSEGMSPLVRYKTVASLAMLRRRSQVRTQMAAAPSPSQMRLDGILAKHKNTTTLNKSSTPSPEMVQELVQYSRHLKERGAASPVKNIRKQTIEIIVDGS
eukprot:TRINITY_DN3003_c0_g1_i1.p2 TRINITY_DN3003_c0_g1~~TRINITY_DN3003_c0_g1_i1.p2  ORF type:complete len:416 (-),score=53.21 TRINITY_DN3003_c0_g1_i1:1644-2891(-)